MASIKRLPSGRWRVRVRDATGREHMRTVDKKSEAVNFAAEVRTDSRRGPYASPGGGRITLATQAEVWLARQVSDRSTQETARIHLRRHVLPLLGERPLGSIRPGDLQAWVADRQRVLAPSTIAVVASFLRAVLNSAVDDG